MRLERLSERLERAGRGWLDDADMRLDSLARRLDTVRERGVERAEARLAVLGARLDGLDPARPLELGYALARKADGTYLRTVDEVRPGDGLDIVLRDGTVQTKVTGAERGGS